MPEEDQLWDETLFVITVCLHYKKFNRHDCLRYAWFGDLWEYSLISIILKSWFPLSKYETSGTIFASGDICCVFRIVCLHPPLPAG